MLQKKSSQALPEPEPSPVTTGRVTVIDVGDPMSDEIVARAWLEGAGEEDLAAGLVVINRALHAFRIATADPYVHEVGREQALVARVGYGAGDQVARGLWSDARELAAAPARRRRSAILQPQARLAGALGGHQRVLACEELALRARADIDHDREREAALQLLVALDAALAELPVDPRADALADRLAELRGRREAVVAAAQMALAGPLDDASRAAVSDTLGRLEAALRARAAVSA
ncbi:MAG: hypothetical protein QOJ25_3221 [Solirubrobacteraceae bacterium]|jgi:hypothetical protein|nr:hypothetical protein [Solirubrobacteraceae bacterium]